MQIRKGVVKMPLIIPKDLPAYNILSKENVFIMNESRAKSQDIRPLRIAIVNLMPTKEETETQLLRMLSNTALQIDIDLIRTKSYTSKNTSKEYLSKFYKTFDDIKGTKYDGMIITGAPVEKMDFDDVKYWYELVEIMEYAKENVYSTMFICWASQAALYHFYGIPKYAMDKKLFGIFKFEVVGDSVVTRGFDDFFYAPQSRYTYNKRDDIGKVDDLIILAESNEAGVHLSASRDNRFVFVAGHVEYDINTLDKEYKRDLKEGVDTDIPLNYYLNDNPNEKIIQRWKSCGNLMFSNWLNYCVYQNTPYDINSISKKIVSKFGGSSLSDAGQFNKVKNIILSESDRKHIVVSAPGKRNDEDTKITDILVNCYELQTKKQELIRQELELLNQKNNVEKQFETILELIENRFTELCYELNISDKIKEELKKVKNEIKNSTDKDFILSRGEYLNAIIMSEYLDYEFIDAKELIYFKDNGELDEEKTFLAIKNKISKDEKIVVPGFYGIDSQGNIRTFKRGGSDITGSILSHAIGADLYENWTDVNGIMTDDPRKNKDATTIDTMTYEELHKMTNNGAQVYHPDAIKLVEEVNIPINVKNTNSPELKGTVIKKS